MTINIPTTRKKTNVVSIASAKPKSTRKTADELLEWREMVMRRDELQHYSDKLDDYVAYHNLQDSDAGSILERAHEEMNYCCVLHSSSSLPVIQSIYLSRYTQ